MQRYLFHYILILIALLVVVGAINLFVDPDGRLRAFDKPGFNQIKVNPPPESRQGKTLGIQQCEHGTIILGSSRAETGIYPGSKQFQARPVYNAALIGTSMREILSLAEFVVRNQKPQIIVLGLDFLTFNAQRDTADDFMDSVLNENQSVASLIKYALSMNTLIGSWITVDWNTTGVAKRCFYNGHNDRRRIRIDHRIAFDEIQTAYMRNSSLYGDFQLSQAHLDNFTRLAQLTVDEDIALKIFISPMHAVHMELLDEAGLIPALHTWKKTVTETVANINAQSDRQEPIVLWDFSGYNSITTETVPEAGSAQQMRWYRDSAHYRVATGDLVLQTLFQSTATTVNQPEDFGVILTPANIDAVLMSEKQRAIAYRRTAPKEVANSRTLAQRARIPLP
jgi:hypothetical protein